MLLRIFLIFGLIAWPLAVLPPSARAEEQTVVINELMWMGSSASSADEWIELRNLTDQPIDLSNWQLTKKSSGVEAAMLTIPTAKSIPSNGFFLISNYGETNSSSMLAITPDVVDTAVTLSNSALQLKLYNAGHMLIDTADDGVGNPAAGILDTTNKIFASMERNPIPGDGAMAQNWHDASRRVGFKSGSSELGTPGMTNSNGIPTAAAGPNQESVVGQIVNFDGSDSSDPEGLPLAYRWDFGDGSQAVDPTPQHAYQTSGTFTVQLTVNDGTDSAGDQVVITIAPASTSTAGTTITNLPTAPENISNSSCRGLHLFEFYPNPPGVDTNEFIELQNSDDEDISAEGCAVWTSATKKYVITDSPLIAKNGFVLLPKSLTKLTLNNGGATIRLVDVNGSELDRVVYDTAKEGASFALINGVWQWTNEPTPGKSNILAMVKSSPSNVRKSTSKKITTKTQAPAQIVSLADVQQLDSGDRVVITGVVTSPVGSLGSTLTTLQSDDGGVTLMVPNGTDPLEVGQRVEITGTIRLYQGRRRVAVDAQGVKVLSTGNVLPPKTMATDDVGADQADQLVHIHGMVALASGATITIDDGSGPLPVYLKSSTGIVRPKVKMGDTVDAVGIVGVSTSGVRLMPRSQGDLHVEKVLGTSTTATSTTLPTSSTHQTLWYWVFVGLGGLAVSVKPLWRKWQARRAG